MTYIRHRARMPARPQQHCWQSAGRRRAQGMTKGGSGFKGMKAGRKRRGRLDEHAVQSKANASERTAGMMQCVLGGWALIQVARAQCRGTGARCAAKRTGRRTCMQGCLPPSGNNKAATGAHRAAQVVLGPDPIIPSHASNLGKWW